LGKKKNTLSEVENMHCTVTGDNGESRAQPHKNPSKNMPMSLHDQRGYFRSLMKI